jgi:tetratricopeptide (TPR) repeat protein
MRKPAAILKLTSGRVFSLLVSCCLLLTAYSSFGQSPAKLFELANDSYKAKNYKQSIEAYQKLLGDGYRNSSIYYNLGNAYYKTDQTSQAILNYERALKLAPSDEDIRFNLKLANLKTVDKITPVPQLYLVSKWQNFAGSKSSKSWGIYSICAVWLGFMAFAAYLFIDSVRRPSFFTGVTLLFLALFFFSLSYRQHQVEYGANEAILTAADTYIKSAPDASSTDLFMIHEGIKLDLLDKVGDWSKVRLADGKIGWVEQNNYTVI